MPLLPVIRTHGRVQVGAYAWNEYTGASLHLSFSAAGPHPELSVVHEIGHFLDHQAFGHPGSFASDAGDHHKEVMDAIGQSAAIRALERLQSRRVILLQVRNRRETEPVDQRMVRYYLGLRERFARAYAQYIALASQSPVLRAQLEATRRTRLAAVYHSQWEDDDFETIRRQFDELFRGMRWRTS